MADFRKLLLALIAGALIFGTVASAADFSCQVSSVPTLVRSEGVADYVGDVLMSCSGDLPLSAVTNGVVANIRLSFLGQPGVYVTSKILDASSKVTEATLVLNNALVGAFPGTRMPEGYASISPVLQPQTDGSQNVYQALWLNDQEIEWQGVLLTAPGSTTITALSVRMTNVRIDAQGLAIGAPINAQLNITSPTSIPIFGNTSVLVANIRQGLLSVNNLGNSRRGCELTPPSGSFTGFTTTFTEGFGTAFRPRLNPFTGPPVATAHYIPGGGYFDESGYNPVGFAASPGGQLNGGALFGGSLVGLPLIGLATQGTQLGIIVTGVPSNLALSFGTITTSNPPNGLIMSAGTVTVSGTTVTMMIEVIGYAGTGDAQFLQDTVTVPITATYSSLPVVGNVVAHGRLLPDAAGKFKAELETVAKLPRFVDSSTTPDATVISLSPCRSILLFPYITSTAGYNTGIAITNASKDPLTGPATVPQAGSCTLSFFGQSSLTALSAAQATQTTISIPSGGQFVTTLTAGAKGSVYGVDGSKTAACDTTVSGNTCADMPAYVGYMIASCNFQYAHGFSFVTDTGSDRTMGYLALVIPDRGSLGRQAQDESLGGLPNQGEQLGF